MIDLAKYKMILRCECGHETTMTGINHQRDFRVFYGDDGFGYDRWVDTYNPHEACGGCEKVFTYFGESHLVDDYIKGELK